MSEIDGRTLTAAFVGEIVDFVGSQIVGYLFGLAVLASSGGTTPDDLKVIVDGSLPLQLAYVFLASLLTLVGAFTAGSLAKGKERTAAFLVGVLSTVFNFIAVFTAPESLPFWAEAAELLLTIPAAFLGGEARLAIARMRRTK